jgi:hypothetical protein
VLPWGSEVLPDSRFVELPDCYPLIPQDQPAALAGEIRSFLN